MKKIVMFFLVASLGCFIGFASESSTATMTQSTTSSYSSRVSIPTGVFFNGRNFIKVEISWVRICIDNQSSEYDIKNAEIDPNGNYALVLEGGKSITIYSNGRTLYYNGNTYSKN